MRYAKRPADSTQRQVTHEQLSHLGDVDPVVARATEVPALRIRAALRKDPIEKQLPLW